MSFSGFDWGNARACPRRDATRREKEITLEIFGCGDSILHVGDVVRGAHCEGGPVRLYNCEGVTIAGQGGAGLPSAAEGEKGLRPPRRDTLDEEDVAEGAVIASPPRRVRPVGHKEGGGVGRIDAGCGLDVFLCGPGSGWWLRSSFLFFPQIWFWVSTLQ